MSDYNSLKELASGVPKAPEIDAKDTLGQREIDRSENFLATNKIKDSKLKFRAWLSENKNWQFTPNNTEYYWDKYTTLHPSKDGKKALMSEVKDKLNAFTDDIERESHIQDNIRSWPDWLRKEIEPWYMSQQSSGTDSNLRNARIVSQDDTHRGCSTWSGSLSHEHSAEVHTDDALIGRALGYPLEDLKIDPDTGRFVVPQEGKMVPLYAIGMPNIPLTEEFILLNDDKPIIKRRVDELMYRSVKEAKEKHNEAIQVSWDKLNTYSISEEFEDDIILDFMGTKEYDESIFWNGLDKIMQKRMEEGGFHRPGDATRYYRKRTNQLLDKFKRRLS
tara:strand:- start:957 stop:1955 length:999 start_codon:yes stop_codon:yes gene_type:complete